MFTKISRAQLLAVTGWSTTDLDNRVHANQLAFAHGLTLPAANGVYIGLDCFALLLSDALVKAGFARALAARFVRESHEKWLHGLERVEWPELYPPPEPMRWAPTKLALDEGAPVPPPDAEIYFAIGQYPDGNFQAASGTILDIVRELALAAHTRPAVAPGTPAYIVRHVHVRSVRETTLAAAEKAGVDLGAPFTRPRGHPEHRDWYAAVEVLRALSEARLKVRKPPGPARAKAKAKGQRPARSRRHAPTAESVT
jgi:hypothetical protein